MREKKNHTTSQDKKITKPLRTKSNALFRDKKNHTFSQDKKKISNLLGKKEITQSLWTKKKSFNILGRKKITKPLGTKKVIQPLGTKKSRNLLGQKNHATFWTKKDATSRDKKIWLSIGQIASKLIQMAKNCPNWSK